MGRARLVFTEDYSIHGTDETASLGTNQSHGSIRVANAAVLDVARLLLQAGGAFDGNDWFNRMTADRTRMHRIDLEHPGGDQRRRVSRAACPPQARIVAHLRGAVHFSGPEKTRGKPPMRRTVDGKRAIYTCAGFRFRHNG